MIAPTEDRPYRTLISSGMSGLPHRDEVAVKIEQGADVLIEVLDRGEGEGAAGSRTAVVCRGGIEASEEVR